MAVTPVVPITHHISITDPDSVETGFMLEGQHVYTDDGTDSGRRTSAPRLRIGRQPPIAPKISQGSTRFSDQSPDVDLTWEQTTFHKGAMSYRWTPERDGQYNEANGVDAHTPQEFSRTNEMRGPFTTFLVDPGFERWNSSTVHGYWIEGESGGTVTRSTTSQSKSYAALLSLTGVGSCSVAQSITTQVLRSRAVTLAVWVRRPAGESGSLDVNISIGDGVATTSSVTTLTDTDIAWGVLTVSRTCDAAATSLVLTIQAENGANGRSVLVDDASVFVGDAIPRALIEYSDNLYLACGRAVFQWNETDDVFAVVDCPSNTEVVNSLAISPFDNVLIAGYGAGATYRSTTNGTTWTSRVGPPGPYATVRNRVWGVLDNDTIDSSQDVTTPTWTAYNNVGTNLRAMNGIFAFNDTILVGKEDGLWAYVREIAGISEDAFHNITPEYDRHPSTEHFTRGQAFNGWLYLTTRRGLIRYDGALIEDITSRVSGAQLSDFGGRIRAFSIDSSWLYILMDTPTSDASATKTTWLMTHHEVDTPIVHTTHKLSIGDLYAAYTYYNGTDTHLFIAGRLFQSGTTYATAIYRLKVTTRHDSPSRDVTPDHDTTNAGTLITAYWDGLLPSVTKSFISLDFRTEQCDANKTVLVEYQVDEDTSWTTLGTVSSNGAQTLYFSTAALAKRSGKRIRLRFTLSTDSATSAPRVLMPLVLHSTYRPRRLRTYEFDVRVGSNLPMANGGIDNTDAATLISTLTTYVNETRWPLTLKEDEDGDGTVTSHTLFLVDASLVNVYTDEITKNRIMVYRLIGIEKVTS